MTVKIVVLSYVGVGISAEGSAALIVIGGKDVTTFTSIVDKTVTSEKAGAVPV